MADSSRRLTVACAACEHEREVGHDRGCGSIPDHSRGGRLFARSRPFPPRGDEPAGGGVCAERFVSAGLARFARCRGRAGRRRGVDRTRQRQRRDQVHRTADGGRDRPVVGRTDRRRRRGADRRRPRRRRIEGAVRRLYRAAPQRGFQGGARGRRGAPMGSLRRSRPGTHRDPHPGRGGWAPRPHPRPPVSPGGGQPQRGQPAAFGNRMPKTIRRNHLFRLAANIVRRSAASGRVGAEPD